MQNENKNLVATVLSVLKISKDSIEKSNRSYLFKTLFCFSRLKNQVRRISRWSKLLFQINHIFRRLVVWQRKIFLFFVSSESRSTSNTCRTNLSFIKEISYTLLLFVFNFNLNKKVSTEYLSIFSTNAGKYRPEKLQIPTLFT